MSTCTLPMTGASPDSAEMRDELHLNVGDGLNKNVGDRLNKALAALDGILERYVADHRQQVVAAFENWWDKNRVTLSEIEEDRDQAASSFREFLGELGCA